MQNRSIDMRAAGLEGSGRITSSHGIAIKAVHVRRFNGTRDRRCAFALKEEVLSWVFRRAFTGIGPCGPGTSSGTPRRDPFAQADANPLSEPKSACQWLNAWTTVK